jgi:hypothetical protein
MARLRLEIQRSTSLASQEPGKFCAVRNQPCSTDLPAFSQPAIPAGMMNTFS